MLISPNSFLRNLAGHCKTRRQAIGLRQADLALRCHVSEQTIARFEKTGRINLDAFARIALALGLAQPLLEACKAKELEASSPKSVEDFLRGEKPRQRIRLPKPQA